MTSKERVYIIAEAGVNHNGSLALAKELVDAAAAAGADAVKFQTFQAEKEISVHAPKADYQKKTTAVTESQLTMVKKLELKLEDHHELQGYCRKKKIDFLSTPFDMGSLIFLIQEMKMELVKISSGDIVTGPLLLAAAQAGCRVILSTGMSNLADVENALQVLAFGYLQKKAVPSGADLVLAYASEAGQKLLAQKVSLLHCTTEYPAPFPEVNLRVMTTLREAFGLSVGYSDHTQGIAVPVAAAALGARILEKHITTDRKLPGPDHKASLEPHELAEMVKSVRQVELALGSKRKMPTPSEVANLVVARKSLVADGPIRAGQAFDAGNLTFKRPGSGISPLRYWDMLGKKARRDYEPDEVIADDH